MEATDRGTETTIRTLFMVLLLSSSCHGNSEWKETSMDDMTCSKLMKRVYHDHVTVTSPPDITGDWVSHRCEVRPGPEFVLRKFKFFNNSHFEAHLYYYLDSSCQEAAFSILSRGSYTMQGSSWTVPGATEVDYQLTYVTVMPYSQPMANALSQKVNQSCHDNQPLPWQPFHRYVLLNYVEFPDQGLMEEDDGYVVVDEDCTHALEFSLHELQLMRQESRQHHLATVPTTSLLLGDIHTERSQRPFYRPTSFQEALYKPTTPGCPVCHLVANSDVFYPASLHPHHRQPVLLSGEWFSERCEARPYGVFLTRHLMFAADNKSWEGYYHHFTDTLCRKPSFSILAKGSYEAGQESEIIPKSYHYEFKVNQMKVTAKDAGLADALRRGTCGGPSTLWTVGEEVDVTEAGGCPALSVTVPHVEPELLKIERDHHKTLLFLGQGTTDPKKHEKLQRPTSFQPPLVLCNQMPRVSLSYSSKEEESSPTPDEIDAASSLHTSILLLLSTLIYVILI